MQCMWVWLLQGRCVETWDVMEALNAGWTMKTNAMYEDPKSVKPVKCSEHDQHCPKKLFFGNGCPKSSRQVVRLGFVYASRYLQV